MGKYFSLQGFREIGREQRYRDRNVLEYWIVCLFGPLDLHSRIRAGHVLRAIRRLSLPTHPRILDAGSGRGLVLFQLAHKFLNFHLEGLDLEPEFVAQAQNVARQMQFSHLMFAEDDLSTKVDRLSQPYPRLST